MPVTVDMSDNYLVWDNTEAVVVQLRRTANEDVNIAVAKGGSIRRRDETALLLVQDTAEKSWNVPNKLLNPANNGREIRREDRITDEAGVVWSAVVVSRIECGCVWRCLCKRIGGA